ncbi:putative serine/threonine protein kinase [Megavirus vitis]|nr:putative serine/threonine protein kinase [Megavirus vitis]
MSYETFAKKYEKIKILGHGTYGRVYEIKDRNTGLIYACKEFVFNNKHITYCNYNELIARSQFKHPNIVEMYDIYYKKIGDDYYYYIIMEKCDTSLSKLLFEDKIIFDKTQQWNFLGQIIEALIYMRNKGYVHSDLSLSNILIRGGMIKIIDFGFMYNRYMWHESYFKNTIYIQSPELVYGYYDICNVNKIDTWSLGNIFYAICYNNLLINNNKPEDYYLDIISKVCTPSTKIISKYGLSKIYRLLYYKLILLNHVTDSCIEDLENNQLPKINNSLEKTRLHIFLSKKITQKQIDKLAQYNLSTKKYQSVFINKTNENIFIKKMLNWSSNYRPDIIDACKIYNRFVENKIPILITKPKLLYFREYSFNKLLNKTKEYCQLFNDNGRITVHFKHDVLLFTKYGYNLIAKSVELMTKLYTSCLSKMSKFKCLTKLHHVTKNYHTLSQMQKLEYSFDRFYAINHVIYEHHNDLDIYILYESSVLLENYADLQHHFLELLDYNIPSINAYDMYLESVTNRIYENKFKFIYYLILSNPNILRIHYQILAYAIILIIMGFDQDILRQKLINQYLKINIIVDFNNNEPNINNTDSVDIINCIEIPNNIFNIPSTCLNADVIITSYYIISIIGKIPDMYINRCVKYFCVGSKFLEYLKLFYSIGGFKFK